MTPLVYSNNSLYPFAPVKSEEIPNLLTVAAMDYAYCNGGVDQAQANRVMLDLNRRANLDVHRADLDLTRAEEKALTYAGALGEIDALHIEWAQTNMLDPANNLALWDRLGAILRKAGI